MLIAVVSITAGVGVVEEVVEDVVRVVVDGCATAAGAIDAVTLLVVVGAAAEFGSNSFVLTFLTYEIYDMTEIF